ncbi:MAG: hypothetical protein JWM93_2374 [Frankiales bacterium]|nr:hypothetical protein [Frankiales bacterium]
MSHRRVVLLLLAMGLVGGASASCTHNQPPSPAAGATPATSAPAGATDGEVSVVGRRDFAIRLNLPAVTAMSTSVDLETHPQLQVNLSLRRGATVRDGEVVGKAVVRPEILDAMTIRSRSSGVDRSQMALLERLAREIKAPVTGVLDVINGVPSIRSAGIDVVAAITPVQQLRYQSTLLTGTATIQTVVGMQAVKCLSVWMSSMPGVEAPTTTTTGAARTIGASSLHCRLPAYAETAGGLQSALSVQSETLRDVTVVPAVAIGYDDTVDGYYVIIADGTHRKVPVEVGATDGVVRVVTSPLPADSTLEPLADGS